MKRRRRHGFTLIELVASAVLAAMMTAALLGVVWSSIRETQQLRRSEQTKWPITQLVTQMRRDFHNARGMSATATGVTLHGFLDQDSAGASLRVGTVRYHWAGQAGRGVLIRHASSSQGPTIQPVWYRFGSLRIEPLDDSDAEAALLDLPEAGGLPPVPSRFRVTLYGDQGDRLWREVIHHHAI
jgi:prepilin-type N-terminal cleavage/methylation domain-containing protein